MLVNDIWGGEKLFEWDTPVWEHDLENGLRMLRLAVDTHLITATTRCRCCCASPAGWSSRSPTAPPSTTRPTTGVGLLRPVQDASSGWRGRSAQELAPHGATAVALTPGWLRSEMMLEHFGVREDNWRDAAERIPHFCISETPRYVGRAVAALASDPDVARWNGQSLSVGAAGAGLRLHRSRRHAAGRLALHRRAPRQGAAGRRQRLPVAIRAVTSSAGKNDSSRISCSVTSCGVPTVVTSEK